MECYRITVCHCEPVRRLVWQSPGRSGSPSRIRRGRCPHRPKTRESAFCSYPSYHKYFSAGPSGGNVLVSARTLIRSRLRGRCRKAAPLSTPPAALTNCVSILRLAMGGEPERYGVIARRPCGPTWPLPGIPSGHNPFSKAFPAGEGGSRVSRKRETDEGLASPYGRGAPGRGRRGRILPSQSASPPAPPEGEPRGTKGTDCDQRDSPEGATPACALVRNDMRFEQYPGNKRPPWGKSVPGGIITSAVPV